MAERHVREEFAGLVDDATIERVVADSARRMPTDPVAADRLARERLRAVAAVASSGSRTPAVLFLCVHNAGRSQMAAGWMRSLAGDRVTVFTGGSAPASDDEVVVASMAEVGIDITGEFPKPWTDEVLRAVDVVVTMGCGDECPFYPGTRYVDWSLEDPRGKDIDTVRRIRDEVRAQVEALLAELGV